MFFSKQLNQFIALAKNGSLNQAAESTNVTSSAISQGLILLEKKLGKNILVKKKNKILISDYGMELFNKINPHYESINKILNNLTVPNNEKKIKILIDGFPFYGIHSIINNLLKNKSINIEVECKISNDILYEIKNHHYDIIISPVDIDVDHKSIQKINLKTERLGLVFHKELMKKSMSIEKMMNNEILIQTKSSFEHCTMIEFLKEIKKIGVKFKTLTINELDLLHSLENKTGYSFMTEEYFNNKSNPDLVFKKEPFNFFLNRRAYLLKESNIEIY
ncbi:LysR family transcriptional regulator [Providencia rettgeri]